MSSVWRHWAQNFLGIGWTRLLIHNVYVSSLQCSSFHLCIIIPNAPLSVSNVSLPTLLTFEWALEMGDWEESRRSKEGKRRVLGREEGSMVLAAGPRPPLPFLEHTYIG